MEISMMKMETTELKREQLPIFCSSRQSPQYMEVLKYRERPKKSRSVRFTCSVGGTEKKKNAVKI